ncbi:MAG: acetate--CoA ligase family protein [Deltaproteobacteria bacterium]|nr:acetate--CoA ligase family protein [Deltaproteobacteria bacterium]
MDFFFKPNGIAVVGATKKMKGGYAIVVNLKAGYKGPIYPVNPRYDEIEGLACYPDIESVPDPVELAVVFVPAPAVPGIVRACAKRGIKGVMIESAGFSETGPEGAALQQELKDIVAETGIRVWGPNCVGLVDAKNRHVFSFVSPAIWNEGPIPGRVSLVVQSGMLAGGFLVDTMSHGTMGVSKVCSIGNKADVSETDLLQYLLSDPDTEAVAMYLESIPDGRLFTRLCAGAKKPVVVLKGGKSERGAAAAMSHTASLAGNGAVVSGALAAAGVTEAVDFKQMMDLSRALAMVKNPPSSGRVAVLTYSGGAGIISTDFLYEQGLSAATLSGGTKEALARVFPEWMPVNNPVDLWPAVEKNGAGPVYTAAMEAVAADEGVDALLLHVYIGGLALTLDPDHMAAVAKKTGKPVFIWLIGEAAGARNFHLKAQEAGIPVFRELYRAVECMAAVFHQARGKRHAPLPDASAGPAPSGDFSFLERSGVLDEYDAKKLLAACGVETVAEAVADSPEKAAALAQELGFPVVMKGLAPGEVHKTERGLVTLGVASGEQAEKEYARLSGLVGEKGRVLVQKQAAGGPELICGMFRDPQFGPTVMAGLGGVYAEVLADTAFGLAPLSEDAAVDLIGRLKTQKLLDGFRNTPPVDRKALARVLTALGNLAVWFPRVSQVDVNPLICVKGKPVAVDATVILE